MLWAHRSRDIVNVTTISTNKAFDSIKSKLKDEQYQVITLTTCNADRHVKGQSDKFKWYVWPCYIRRSHSNLPPNTRQGRVFKIPSSRERVTGKQFHYLGIYIYQYVQSFIGGSNKVEKETSIDALYLDRNDNRSGHIVFKLNTRTFISVNQVKIVLTPFSIVHWNEQKNS